MVLIPSNKVDRTRQEKAELCKKRQLILEGRKKTAALTRHYQASWKINQYIQTLQQRGDDDCYYPVTKF